MRVVIVSIVCAALAALCVPVCTAYPTYTGTLDVVGGGLVGTGAWGTGPTTFSWTVGQVSDTLWGYEYTLSVPGGDVSHLLIELSPGVENISTAWSPIEYDDWMPGGGNPNMPGPMYGVKFDEASGLEFTVSFTVDRMPVWGDFYAKDGRDNTIWNSGFLADDPTVSYTTPYTDASVFGHILRPDTRQVIPAPGALLLGAVGVASVGWLRRRRAL